MGLSIRNEAEAAVIVGTAHLANPSDNTELAKAEAEAEAGLVTASEDQSPGTVTVGDIATVAVVAPAAASGIRSVVAPNRVHLRRSVVGAAIVEAAAPAEIREAALRED